ncbi:MAG: protein-L-isoaspartate(D-aspartate) O-methyltransferase [Candidatus Adiutrix sp.]
MNVEIKPDINGETKRDSYRIARRKMIETQLKNRGITDKRVLEAIYCLPRHFFVDEAMAAQSHGDFPLPIGCGQTISQPYIVAYMIQTLALKPGDKVLEIGFGSGYQTALLALLAKEVFAIERLMPMYKKGQENLAQLDLPHIHLKLDDGSLGWAEKAPFDVIVVGAGGPKVPEPLVAQLALGGRLIMPVGPNVDSQQLVLVRKDLAGAVEHHNVGACRFVNLVGRHAWSGC